jgi:hypothetical protein
MTRVALGIALMMSAAAQAADPPAPAPKPAASRPAPVSAQAAPTKPAVRKPLDLRLRDMREYVTTEQFRALMNAPDADSNTVVVEGTKLLPMQHIENVPPGLASLWYAAKHPANAWRIFAPIVNAPEFQNESKVPPPIFRWGP